MKIPKISVQFLHRLTYYQPVFIILILGVLGVVQLIKSKPKVDIATTKSILSMMASNLSTSRGHEQNVITAKSFRDAWGNAPKYGFFTAKGARFLYVASAGPNIIWDSKFSSLKKPERNGDDLLVIRRVKMQK